MADVVMSADVRELLGAEMIERVTAAARAGGRCVGCPEPFDGADAVSVLVLRGGTEAHVGYAHTRCAPSGVVDVDDATLVEAEPGEATMVVEALLLDYAPGPAPALICEMTSTAYQTAGPHGEVTNAVVSTLLARGWTLVGRLREAPRTVPAGWAGTLSPGSGGAVHLQVTDTSGDLFYAGSVVASDDWLLAVLRVGWCVLYAGAVTLPPEPEPGATRTMLRATAAAGGLVAARLPVAVQTS